uniref:Uncharacterized protein n=1 Tax=viral metagenome TaxID=1070528 RepID=A0A6M3IN39_9ZZZZ
MKGMKAKIVSMLLGMLLDVIQQHGGKLMGQVVDGILDAIESAVLGSSSTVDDAIVIPICNMIRTALNVPDND